MLFFRPSQWGHPGTASAHASLNYNVYDMLVGKRFVIDVAKDRLQTAPGFDKDHWPDLGDLEYANGIFPSSG